jgi:hypothetical protein
VSVQSLQHTSCAASVDVVNGILAVAHMVCYFRSLRDQSDYGAPLLLPFRTNVLSGFFFLPFSTPGIAAVAAAVAFMTKS